MAKVKIGAISPQYRQPTSFLAGFVSFLGRLPISCRKPISFGYRKDMGFLHISEALLKDYDCEKSFQMDPVFGTSPFSA